MAFKRSAVRSRLSPPLRIEKGLVSMKKQALSLSSTCELTSRLFENSLQLYTVSKYVPSCDIFHIGNENAASGFVGTAFYHRGSKVIYMRLASGNL